MISCYETYINVPFAEFLQLVENLEGWLGERVAHNAEVGKLQADLMKSQSEVTRLEKKLKNAQHLLGLEKEKRIASEHQVSVFDDSS